MRWLLGGNTAAQEAAQEAAKKAAQEAAEKAAYEERWAVVKRSPLSRKEHHRELVANAEARRKELAANEEARKTADVVKAHQEKKALLAKAAEESKTSHFKPVAQKENPFAKHSIFTNYIAVGKAIDPKRAAKRTANLEAKLSKGNTISREHPSHEEILLQRKTAWIDRNKEERNRYEQSLEKVAAEYTLIQDKQAPVASKPSLFTKRGKDLSDRRNLIIAQNKAMSAQDKAARREREAERYGAIESQTKPSM